jgi:hypothetical protein
MQKHDQVFFIVNDTGVKSSTMLGWLIHLVTAKVFIRVFLYYLVFSRFESAINYFKFSISENDEFVAFKVFEYKAMIIRMLINNLWLIIGST